VEKKGESMTDLHAELIAEARIGFQEAFENRLFYFVTEQYDGNAYKTCLHYARKLDVALGADATDQIYAEEWQTFVFRTEPRIEPELWAMFMREKRSTRPSRHFPKMPTNAPPLKMPWEVK
jgi:hypothetical protein